MDRGAECGDARVSRHAPQAAAASGADPVVRLSTDDRAAQARLAIFLQPQSGPARAGRPVRTRHARRRSESPARSEHAQCRWHGGADRDRALGGRRAARVCDLAPGQRSTGHQDSKRRHRSRPARLPALGEVRQPCVDDRARWPLLPALPRAGNRAAGRRAVLWPNLLSPSWRRAVRGHPGVRTAGRQGHRAVGRCHARRPVSRRHGAARRQRRQRNPLD